ncbi:proline-rich extensin-like protein EPR1 [Papaver somniferum]|uniref:proline-rich extensin-like protein EPR1 n=1 Tax=Papaver somniferum TaxID=3469 RepID=UPI000E6F5447|nr:proline-rich extensin-like protein EPR1 [Papaver somniferum]
MARFPASIIYGLTLFVLISVAQAEYEPYTPNYASPPPPAYVAPKYVYPSPPPPVYVSPKYPIPTYKPVYVVPKYPTPTYTPKPVYVAPKYPTPTYTPKPVYVAPKYPTPIYTPKLVYAKYPTPTYTPKPVYVAPKYPTPTYIPKPVYVAPKYNTHIHPKASLRCPQVPDPNIHPQASLRRPQIPNPNVHPQTSLCRPKYPTPTYIPKPVYVAPKYPTPTYKPVYVAPKYPTPTYTPKPVYVAPKYPTPTYTPKPVYVAPKYPTPTYTPKPVYVVPKYPTPTYTPKPVYVAPKYPTPTYTPKPVYVAPKYPTPTYTPKYPTPTYTPSQFTSPLKSPFILCNLLDYQRRLTKLEKENAKLKAENSTNSDLIRRARERNDELIDLYNLSDEAANLPDGETLLEHLNSSLNNYPNQGFENMNLEELRLKYAALRKSHRSLLTTFNNFKHRLHESQEQIQVLETKKNKLIDEKDEITLKGAKALEKFQESIVEVQKEHKEKNYLQKIEELETRLASEKEKNYPQNIEELKTRLASEEKDLFARNSKYHQLKKNFIIMVSNNSNDANRAREAAVKNVCVENNIPLTKYKFLEIPDNEHISDIFQTVREEMNNLKKK